MDLEKIISIAFNAHKGQIDLDGNPVILHPLKVGIDGENDYEKATGFLHDVIEDTSLTLEDLRKYNIDEKVITAVQLLTHDKEIPYFDYIQQIIDSKNSIAINTKHRDLLHNLYRGRLGGHIEKIAKYEKALAMIENALKAESKTGNK